MNRTTIEDSAFPDCPIRNILSKLCDKWSLLVIYTLNKAGKKTTRFKELQREIPDISQKMLTVTLRTLENDGYVTRTVYPEVPPRVEYALTPRTHSLLPHIDALIKWALENSDAIMRDRKRANLQITTKAPIWHINRKKCLLKLHFVIDSDKFTIPVHLRPLAPGLLFHKCIWNDSHNDAASLSNTQHNKIVKQKI